MLPSSTLVDPIPSTGKGLHRFATCVECGSLTFACEGCGEALGDQAQGRLVKYPFMAEWWAGHDRCDEDRVPPEEWAEAHRFGTLPEATHWTPRPFTAQSVAEWFAAQPITQVGDWRDVVRDAKTAPLLALDGPCSHSETGEPVKPPKKRRRHRDDSDEEDEAEREYRRAKARREGLRRDAEDQAAEQLRDLSTVAASRTVTGAHLFELPATAPAIWGEANRVGWMAGESLMIASPPGIGKTTLATCLVFARLGLGDREVLGMPVVEGRHVLYLAMDRPDQILRAFQRQVVHNAAWRDVLAERLTVWRGPLTADLAKNPELLCRLAELHRADTVVIDSLKDAVMQLSQDEPAAGYNRARQLALAAGIELMELHHTRKSSADGGVPKSAADVYGSTWLTGGAGSVFVLEGESGSPIVTFHHRKSPSGAVPRFKAWLDTKLGLVSLIEAVEPVALAGDCGHDGISARELARRQTGKQNPSPAEVEKARRDLLTEVDAGVLERFDSPRTGGGRPEARFRLTPRM
ncbi:AAA family ATPase [Nonomuraea sp. NPDC050328]|uniref:AAA family ATPase n=1 Tax=Nonomuraea sp. NPDC050328 TaxID=3364361 RepID=UPI0037B9977B